MKPLVLFALLIMAILAVTVAAVNVVAPPDPVLLIDAAVPAIPAGPLVLVLPPQFGKSIWCEPPANARPSGRISRT